jgi:ankyrin repeat protein
MTLRARSAEDRGSGTGASNGHIVIGPVILRQQSNALGYLCQFLIENGADVNLALPDTGETPLHAALSSTRPAQNLVARVLLAKGADPNHSTKPSI